MNLEVHVPEQLEPALQAVARQASLSPSLFLEGLLRRELELPSAGFSDGFAALTGCWEDDRSADEICQDIEQSRVDAQRPGLG